MFTIRKRRPVIILAIALIMVLLSNSVLIAAPRDLTDAEKERIKSAAEFLSNNGEEEWSDDVSKWLKEGRIKSDPDMASGTNATTSRDGTITIRGALMASLTKEESASGLETWKKDLDLARLLIHEKTHAHYQAPGSPTFQEDGHQASDWLDTANAYRHCRGPEATEMEAYYNFIMVLLTWYKDTLIQEQQVTTHLTNQQLPDDERAALQEAKAELTDRKQFLIDLIQKWVNTLKDHNYEKGSYLADAFKLIEDEEGSEADKLGAKIDELLERIENLFGEDGAYERARTAVMETTKNPITVTLEDLTEEINYTDGIIILPLEPTEDQEYELELCLYDPYPPAPEGFEPVLLAGTESPVFGISSEQMTSDGEDLYITVILQMEMSGQEDISLYSYGLNKPPVWERVPEQSLDTESGMIKAVIPSNGIFAVLSGSGDIPDDGIVDPVSDDIEIDNADSAAETTVNEPPLSNSISAVLSIGSTTYTVNGKSYAMDAAPYIKDDRTYVPVRYLAYALGLDDSNISWDNESRTAILYDGQTRVELTIGVSQIIINGTASSIDVAPEISNDRTMLPARFVAEAFGAEVGWDSDTRSVNVWLE